MRRDESDESSHGSPYCAVTVVDAVRLSAPVLPFKLVTALVRQVGQDTAFPVTTIGAVPVILCPDDMGIGTNAPPFTDIAACGPVDVLMMHNVPPLLTVTLAVGGQVHPEMEVGAGLRIYPDCGGAALPTPARIIEHTIMVAMSTANCLVDIRFPLFLVAAEYNGRWRLHNPGTSVQQLNEDVRSYPAV